MKKRKEKSVFVLIFSFYMKKEKKWNNERKEKKIMFVLYVKKENNETKKKTYRYLFLCFLSFFYSNLVTISQLGTGIIFWWRMCGRIRFQEKKRSLGSTAPKNIWHILRWKKDLAIHEIKPENPMTFQKRQSRGGG